MNKQFIKALKIAIACCLSIFVAEMLNLDYSGSAGIVALLTITDSRHDTLNLAWQRFLSFIVSMIIAIFMFEVIHIHWITFSIFILLVVFISYMNNWHGTISVNAVIGTHILFTDALTVPFVINEFCIVFIGSVFAILLNMIFPRKQYLSLIKKDIKIIEESFQNILFEMADYLLNKTDTIRLWEDIQKLDSYLLKSMERAVENRKNIMKAYSHYYIDYMDMRSEQVDIIKNIHFKLEQLTRFPKSCESVANFIYYLIPYVKEDNMPHKQKETFIAVKDEVFKDSKDDFENIAILYSIVLDLEEFLNININFVENINEEHKERYWK